jgi:hypothetical protein
MTVEMTRPPVSRARLILDYIVSQAASTTGFAVCTGSGNDRLPPTAINAPTR